jgi:hypothetical protein
MQIFQDGTLRAGPMMQIGAVIHTSAPLTDFALKNKFSPSPKALLLFFYFAKTDKIPSGFL